MKHFALIAALLLGFCSIYGQVTPTDYTPLKAAGSIPLDFITPSYEKVADLQYRIAEEQNKLDKKSKKEFLVSSNYILNKLLLSGKVLFNDPVSNYLNSVMQNLLKDEPELKSKIKIYAVKSAAVNAFATDNGIILVNVGLLAQLENEAQLAFVLSHEVSHYVKGHAMDMYVNSSKIQQSKGIYKDFSLDDRLLAKSNYSKELETVADELGLERFVKTTYSLKAIEGAFDVLEYADMPFDEVPFDKSFFESENLVFPKSYFEKKKDADEEERKASDEEEDTEEGEEDDEGEEEAYDSHPSVPERRINLHPLYDSLPNANRVDFIVSEVEFKKVRDLCRFECSRIYLTEMNYEHAIYNSYLLLKKYPDNIFLKKNIAKALLALTVYNNEGEFYSVHYNYHDIKGESQQLFYLMDQLKEIKKELNAIALHYAWKLKQQYPNDLDIQQTSKQLLEQLAVKLHVNPKDFSRTPKTTVDSLQMNELVKEEEKVKDEEESKYSKLKKKKKKTSSKSNYYFYALVDLFQDKDFEKTYQSLYSESNKDKTKKSLSYNEQRKQQKQIQKKGLSLGIDKVAMIDPVYLKIDMRSGKGIEYNESEKAAREYLQLIDKSAQTANLDVSVISSNDLKPGDVNTFNDLSILNEWLDEQVTHEDSMFFSVIDKADLDYLRKKYGTRYMMWNGVIAARKMKTNFFLVITTCVYAPILPVTMPFMIQSRKATYYYSLVFDMEENKLLMAEYQKIVEKDRKALLASHLYFTFNQIKHKTKK
ncbi:MAG: M48 family metallopeptidase [Chitinophagales bacterium]|nr:M48 family metallopeptidase [Chitinophagales bacterium]